VILTYTIYTRVSVNTYEISKLPDTPGFWTEEFQSTKQPAVQDQVIAGRHYRKAQIRKVAVFPTRTGKLTVDPLEVTCQVQVQESQKKRRDPFDMLFNSPFSRYRTEERFVETEPLELTVLPLPSEGKPEGFNGAVGNFSMEVNLDRKEVTTNQALTMKVRFAGTGNVKLLQEPNFEAPADFECYDPKESVNVNKSGKQITGFKTFEYVLIPRIPGKSQLPPIEFTYFDPSSKTYKTITKGGYEIQVERGDDEAITSVNGLAKEDVRLLAEDIHYLMTLGSLKPLQSAWYIPKIYWVLMALAPIMGIVLFWVARLMGAATLRARRKDRKTYLNAKKELQAILKEASGSAKTEDTAIVHGRVHNILLNYLGRRFDLPASGLKKEEVLKLLQKTKTDDDIISTLDEIFNECDAARFAPKQADEWQLNRIVKRTSRIIDKMEEKWSTSHTKGSGKLSILIFMFLLSVTASNGLAQSPGDFSSDAAEELYRSGDYTAAISMYEQVIEQGWTSGEIYYNLGNCYYKKVQYGQAILQYERAKRLMGNNPDLVDNLKLANLHIYDRIEPLPRLFIIKAFFTTAELLTVRSWARLFIVTEWLLLLTLIGLYTISKPNFRVILGWSFIILLTLSICSGSFFLQQKISKDNLIEGIVLVENVEVRSAPESGSTEIFTLHEGVKITILREVSGWAEVQLLDGKQGWIPLEVFETI